MKDEPSLTLGLTTPGTGYGRRWTADQDIPVPGMPGIHRYL